MGSWDLFRFLVIFAVRNPIPYDGKVIRTAIFFDDLQVVVTNDARNFFGFWVIWKPMSGDPLKRLRNLKRKQTIPLQQFFSYISIA